MSDRLDFQDLIERGERIYAPAEAIEIHGVAELCGTRLQPDQGDDKLQIVLHAMLQLLEQQVLVADIALELVALRAFLLGHIDQSCNAVVLAAVLVLDDADIGLRQPRPLLEIPSERPEKILAFGDGRRRAGALALFSCKKPSRTDQPFPFKAAAGNPLSRSSA